MDTRQAYNDWAAQYDTNLNRTRDLEARSLRVTLEGLLMGGSHAGAQAFDTCLEIGCGTGKNTVWLIEKARQITAVDLSEEMLAPIFRNVADSLKPGGYVYIGELHPYKQYAGSKARFETPAGTQVVDCFNHHVSDFTELSRQYGLTPVLVNEYFDDDDRSGIPRILTVVLQKRV